MNQPMICQICQRVLDGHYNADGVTFVHSGPGPADHEPVPVQAPAGWEGGRCDFCAMEPPRFVLPTRPFSVPGSDIHMSDSGWACCEQCAQRIQSDDWGALVVRAVAGFEKNNGVLPDPVGVLGWIVLHTLVRQNVTGPLKPLSEGE